jgi:SNF2 family DNA or RNA helicase
MTEAALSDFVADQLKDERARDFQVEGAHWIQDRKVSGILADQPGTGKTMQDLLSIEEHQREVVVCPAVAKGVWANETIKWRPDLNPVILEGRGMFRWPRKGEVVICNYDILPDKPPPFPAGDVQYKLTGDEAHMLKTGSEAAIRTRRFRALSRQVRKAHGKAFGLTGSPLLNHPLDLWHLLTSFGLEEEAFGSFPEMKRLFQCSLGGFGEIEWGMPLPEVPGRLKRVMLRRLRRDVLKDLKGKAYQQIPVEIDRETKLACDLALEALKERGISFEQAIETAMKTDGGNLKFSEWSRAEMMLAVAKIPAMFDVVRQFEANDEPLVVYSPYKAPIEALNKRKGWVGITGDSVPGEERFRVSQSFQEGRLKGVGMTIRSGGVSLTLTRSHYGLFVGKDPVPEINGQAEDRLDRFGQENLVFIMDLVADHYLDRKKASMLARKMDYVQGTVGA